MEPKIPKIEWHAQQSKLLQKWAEVASSYRWMHNQAYMIYKKKNMWFMLPLIVMSTVTGTANFAQATFPVGIRPYVPQMIGAINLFSAIMTTIYQFLKISEFMESHRISSISYGKLARNLTVELNLPVKDRNSGGAECIKISRTEIDRLIEQCPAIPKKVLVLYEKQFAGKGLSEPEIVIINKVDIYTDQENKVATTVAEAGMKMKSLIKKSNNDFPRDMLNKELNSLPKLVSLLKNKNLATVIQIDPEPVKPVPEPVKPVPEPVKFEILPEIIPELLPEPINFLPEIIPEIVNFIPEPVNFIPEIVNFIPEPESEILIINDTVDEIVDTLIENTIKSEAAVVIENDLDLLRSSKLVSSKKESI